MSLSDIHLSRGNCGGGKPSLPGKEGAAKIHGLVLRHAPRPRQCKREGLQGWTTAGPGTHCLQWLETRAGDTSVGPFLPPRPLPSLPSPSTSLALFRSHLLFLQGWSPGCKDPRNSDCAFAPRPTPRHSTCPEFPVPEPLIEKEGSAQVKNTQLQATTWGSM